MFDVVDGYQQKCFYLIFKDWRCLIWDLLFLCLFCIFIKWIIWGLIWRKNWNFRFVFYRWWLQEGGVGNDTGWEIPNFLIFFIIHADYFNSGISILKYHLTFGWFRIRDLQLNPLTISHSDLRIIIPIIQRIRTNILNQLLFWRISAYINIFNIVVRFWGIEGFDDNNRIFLVVVVVGIRYEAFCLHFQ